ncbi:TIGR03576 family pyridoxal phosphate-dependent enzyme [Methanobrevibacter arboriphilus]|jgi:L-seryl-tRNA(Ser) seleniumtransferase|uniref:TIGR03576 family pyridoxal phosphate-dependent enzyme n=1 Tax=Methanobrevibacter arboriphilus TaxID=39441 RepID=A0ACA8R2V1_METAZ|nr:TIGR03576 family pyridoxal phosphate-dependent enzyme [Methanobrevibacter arboriphilus]BBL61637.1 TIGR03576 family pyridoxal phosphate-dependent enzyme [Methanobrevibacter arboriphilus]GLI12491.1 TIGR03576 family pyridoxal phosphate-dependent enzyme [Methanobrevibacter arboriphilus]
MLIKNSLDEMKKREISLKVIKSIIDKKGKNSLCDLTGLSGGFLAKQNDLNLLETYIGPAIFEEELQIVGKEHLGGEKIFAANRTSSGILATILAIVKKNTSVIHFLPEFPSHPSIPRSCKLVGAKYLEFDNVDDFKNNFLEDTSLVIITGSTMDHKILEIDDFKDIIGIAKNNNIPVLVDDASGARLRTAIYFQDKATDLGADLVVTSTDKLMMGPRGGLMAGKSELIDKIKTKAHQFGLEAQPPSILAMVKGLEEYDENNLRKSLSKKEKLVILVDSSFSMFEETPTGIMVSEKSLEKEVLLNNEINPNISSKDLCFLWAMILLKEENIITIPAVSMPGASPTIRFDLAANDAKNLDINLLFDKINSSFKTLLTASKDESLARKVLFNIE